MPLSPDAPCQPLLEDGEFWIKRVVHSWYLGGARNALSLQLNQGLQQAVTSTAADGDKLVLAVCLLYKVW
jgi:hypothetical protein